MDFLNDHRFIKLATSELANHLLTVELEGFTAGRGSRDDPFKQVQVLLFANSLNDLEQWIENIVGMKVLSLVDNSMVLEPEGVN